MSSPETLSHDSLIAELSTLTTLSPQEARQYLEANQWDLSSAATEYYTSLEDLTNQEEVSDADINPEDTQANPPGPRTLGGDPAPQPIPTTSNMPAAPSSSAKQPSKKKFATLGDLGGGGSSSHAVHGHKGGDESDEEKQDFFAGGEKSSLAVQNPDHLKRKIIERAKRDSARQDEFEPRGASSRFTGTAHTLGGDDAPSVEVPAPSVPTQPEIVERHLHFWADGFSIDDGPLYNTDDPENADILRMIRQGRAPLDIMNVEAHQEVDVKLEQHDEKYVQPKKTYKPFSGGGQRLGSPTPGDSLGSAPTAPVTTTTATSNSATTSAGPAAPAVNLDDSQPTISLQIRLGDGTRLVSRFNTTHTIGSVYDFINSASSTSRERPWVLMTTFPSKELQDKAQVLGDLSELKRGGVVVQKWQ